MMPTPKPTYPNGSAAWPSEAGRCPNAPIHYSSQPMLARNVLLMNINVRPSALSFPLLVAEDCDEEPEVLPEGESPHNMEGRSCG